MTSAQTPASSTVTAGLPFFIDTHRGLQRIWHDGSTIGFSAADQYYPDLHARVIVLANANNVGIADELATTVFDDAYGNCGVLKEPKSGHTSVNISDLRCFQ
jgi:hypothetical protein